MSRRDEQKILQLEGHAVDALIEFLEERRVEKVDVARAAIAQGAFATVQRRRSALNARDALTIMARREGLAPPPREITDGS